MVAQPLRFPSPAWLTVLLLKCSVFQISFLIVPLSQMVAVYMVACLHDLWRWERGPQTMGVLWMLFALWAGAAGQAWVLVW